MGEQSIIASAERLGDAAIAAINEVKDAAVQAISNTKREKQLVEQRRDDLLDIVALALPYVEDAEKDPAYKPGVVAKLTARMRAA